MRFLFMKALFGLLAFDVLGFGQLSKDASIRYQVKGFPAKSIRRRSWSRL